jgi:hypothetical protein
MFSEFFKRLKYGYPIGGGYRCSSPARGEIVLYVGGNEFSVFIETMVDNSIVVYKMPEGLKFIGKDELVDVNTWEEGVQRLVAHFRSIGKKVEY